METYRNMLIDHVPSHGDMSPWLPRMSCVLENLRAQDRQELLCQTEGGKVFEILPHYDRQRPFSVVMTILSHIADPAWPLAIFGIVSVRKALGEVHLLTAKGFEEIAPSMVRYVRHVLIPLLKSYGFLRVEVRVLETYDQGRRLCGAMQMDQECVVPAFGCHGENFVQYAWVNRMENG